LPAYPSGVRAIVHQLVANQPRHEWNSIPVSCGLQPDESSLLNCKHGEALQVLLSGAHFTFSIGLFLCGYAIDGDHDLFNLYYGASGSSISLARSSS